MKTWPEGLWERVDDGVHPYGALLVVSRQTDTQCRLLFEAKLLPELDHDLTDREFTLSACMEPILELDPAISPLLVSLKAMWGN